ncbi:MAG: hypothetical protein H0X62_11085 [Bacteroidetes bacterium]|nr:hypothetical protein [Bacteroidota bacterium]
MILNTMLLQIAEISNQVTNTGSKIDEMGVVPSLLFLIVIAFACIIVYQHKQGKQVESNRLADQAKFYEERLADQAKVYEARISDLKDAFRK